MTGWGRRSSGENGRRMGGPLGCLLWAIMLLLLILIVAAVLFGGFQTGTKATGSLRPPVQMATAR